MYSTVKTGLWLTFEFSLELKRFAVIVVASFPMRIQPKLLDGSSSQDCTSATNCAVEPQV